MFTARVDGARLRWSAVLLAIVGLSPVPLAPPSGLALAVIGLVGAVLLVSQSRRQSTAPLELLGKGIDDSGDGVRYETGARALVMIWQWNDPRQTISESIQEALQ